MKNSKRRVNSIAWVALLGLSCIAVSASAQLTLTNPTFTTGYDYNNDYNGGTSYYSDLNGRIGFTVGTTNYQAYCIDPPTSFAWDVAGAYTTASLNNFLNTPLTGGLTGYQQQFASSGYAGTGLTSQNTTTVLNNLTNLYSHAYNDSFESTIKAEAFSYVIWEIVGDAVNANSRTSGALRSAGTDSTSFAVGNAGRDELEIQIDAYLAALSSASWTNVNGANLSTTANYVYTVFYDPATSGSPHSGQNFLTVTPGSGGSVPVPGSLALAGLGLMGLVRVQRRRAGR